MTPAPAPMTAGEAAEDFCDWTGLFTNEQIRCWFKGNWPAGGAVTALTGQQMYEACSDAYGLTPNWDTVLYHHQEVWNRAAARLSAPPVAFDHDAVAEEICRAVYVNDFQAEKVAAILRRHAATPATDARAGTAGPATGAQWIKRPEGQASSIKTPKEVGVSGGDLWMESTNGHKSVGGWPYLYDGVARWSADGITWYEKTRATAGGWTASSVEACVGQHVAAQYEHLSFGYFMYLGEWQTAQWIADDWNRANIVAYYILPPVEAQP
jgi:hypothetical protein